MNNIQITLHLEENTGGGFTLHQSTWLPATGESLTRSPEPPPPQPPGRPHPHTALPPSQCAPARLRPRRQTANQSAPISAPAAGQPIRARAAGKRGSRGSVCGWVGEESQHSASAAVAPLLSVVLLKERERGKRSEEKACRSGGIAAAERGR